jgi:hypothetical protein
MEREKHGNKLGTKETNKNKERDRKKKQLVNWVR